jgi:nitrite reductase (NADH) small subunit
MTQDWIEIGCIGDVPVRGARTVRREDGVPIAVLRTGDGEIFALVDRCPHRGGPLSEGIVSGRTVACPLHNWVIELESGEAKAPDVGCAPSIPVKLVGDRIFLALPATHGSAPDDAAPRSEAA